MSKGLAVVGLVALAGGAAFLYSKKSVAALAGPAGQEVINPQSGLRYNMVDVTQVNSPVGQVFFDIYDTEGPILQYTQRTSDTHRVLVQQYVQGPRFDAAAADFTVSMV
jgi:hypothetical protein